MPDTNAGSIGHEYGANTDQIRYGNEYFVISITHDAGMLVDPPFSLETELYALATSSCGFANLKIPESWPMWSPILLAMRMLFHAETENETRSR